MAGDIEAKLLAWVAGQLALRDHHQCIKIELEYSPSSGYRPDPIQSWTPDSHPEYFGILPIEGEADGQEVSDKKQTERRHVFTQRLVAEIISLAEDFSETFSAGTHVFTVRAHKHLLGRATHRFPIKPSFRGDDDGAPLEPTQAGQVAQLMRHIENRDKGFREMMGTFLQSMRHSVDTMREENARVTEQNNKLLAERAEWMARIEEAKSKEHDRDMEHLIIQGKNERQAFAQKKIVNLLPVAMSAGMRALGAKTGPAGGETNSANGAPSKKSVPTPLAQAISKLAVTITDEQKAQLQAALSMEQALCLQEIIASALEGGSIVLPTMASDLIASLRPAQLRQLMEIFAQAQQVMFVQIMQLAKVQGDAQSELDSPNEPAVPDQATEAETEASS
jgi:hypothetical protein